MAQAGISVVQLRRLRGRLRRAREAAHLTQKQVANDLGWSLSKVIRIETGATTISTSDVMAMIHYYRVPESEAEELLTITRAKERSSWWDEYPGERQSRFVLVAAAMIGKILVRSAAMCSSARLI